MHTFIKLARFEYETLLKISCIPRKKTMRTHILEFLSTKFNQKLSLFNTSSVREN